MPPAPDQILRQHHRHRRGTLLVWALACALIAALFAGAAHLGWWTQALLPGAGFSVAALICLTVWFVRARRLTRESLARHLDTEWQLSSRLESSHEVAADPTAFASALRDDAARHLATHKLPSALGWQAGLVVLALALLCGVFESGILTWRLLATSPAIAQPVPLPADISATIDWRKPDSEIKATAIEEIPLVAQTTTATGFRQVTLEVSINGKPVLSRPLDSAVLQPLAKPGAHPISLSFYLDELEAQPFDIVAYHLRADRLTVAPAPAVTSPLQLIQIRPAREDVTIFKVKAGDGPSLPIFELAKLIGALKAAQLALLKQNFLLSHAPLAKTDPVWTAENTRVATDQATFADKVIEARAFAIKEELPTLVVDNLTQIEPLAREASALIAKVDNEAATPLQGRSLGLIADLERLIRKILLDIEGAAKASKPEPKNPDPFKDDQKFRLPPRKLTVAGKLEELSEKQTEQTKENEKAPDGSPDQQTAADKQADLAKQLADLAASKKLASSAQAAAERAARDAQKAADQLNKNDSAAARSPAAAAAQALKEGVAAQEKAGRETALAQLDAARRAINEAARIPDPAARAARLAEIASQLHEDARAQQEAGSAEAARQLEAAAHAAQKASEAASQGRDQKPGAKPGNENSGDKPGDKPGSSDQPAPGKGTSPAGLSPEPGDVPALAPDPSGSVPAKAPGSSPTPGTEPGASPGQSESKEKGEGQGKGEGEGSGTQPGDQPGGGSGSSTSRTVPSSLPGQTAGSGNQPGQLPAASPLENATETAAQAEVALAGYRASLERALRQLESGQGSGPGSRQLNPRDRTNLQLATQLSDALLHTPQSGGLRREVEKDLRPFDAEGNVIMPAELTSAVDQLRVLLQAALGSARRDEIVRRYNPDDIPPAYRDAVERYFEQLSREAVKP